MISGASGGVGSSPSHDFSAPNVESIFGQPTCFCACCNGHQNSHQSENKPMNANSRKPPQVLTFPDSKSPTPSFNEGRRINISTSSATSWKADFQCPSYPNFKLNDSQQQPMNQMSCQHCCFPSVMGGGSVEIVKVGEGPPLTWADLQRHGAFAFPDGVDWATPMQPQKTLPMQQPLQIPPQKCPHWKTIGSNEQKRSPISKHSNWTQRRKPSQPILELPPDFMIHQPSPPPPPQAQHRNANSKPSGYFYDQSKLITATAQTESSINYPQHYYHPLLMTNAHTCNQCSCGAQNFNVEPWQGGEDSYPMRGISEFQQKKFSLPPASHHSPEQRTSYRAKRIF